MLADNHKDKVNNPKDKTKSDKADNTCNNLSFHETRKSAENPCCERNNCADNAYDVRKSKVIAFLVCHFTNSFLFFLYYITLITNSQ